MIGHLQFLVYTLTILTLGAALGVCVWWANGASQPAARSTVARCGMIDVRADLHSRHYLFPPSVDLEEKFNLGKVTFRTYCGSCHAKDMRSDLTGPALGGVEERWAAYPREALYRWIRNSQAMITSGHPRAVQLWDDWRPTLMTSFPNLTDEEIEATLFYIDYTYTAGY